MNEGVNFEEYTVGESLCAYGGADIGSSNDISEGNGDYKLYGYPLGK